MTHAIVLIQAEGSALATLGGELAGIDGVAEAYSVTGEWDFVAILRLREQEMLAQVVTGRLSVGGWSAAARQRGAPAACVLVGLWYGSGVVCVREHAAHAPSDPSDTRDRPAPTAPRRPQPGSPAAARARFLQL